MLRTFGRLLIHSQELAKHFYLDHAQVVEVWYDVLKWKSIEYCRQHFMPGVDSFNWKADKIHREVYLSRNMTVAACRGLNGRHIRSVITIYDRADSAYVNDEDAARLSTSDWSPLDDGPCFS